MIEPPPAAFVHAFREIYRWLVPRLDFIVQQGGTPTSWFRTVARNAAVFGAPTSQHLFGFAADFVPRGGSILRLAGEARRTGLIVVPETDHLHVQIFPRGTLERIGLLV